MIKVGQAAMCNGKVVKVLYPTIDGYTIYVNDSTGGYHATVLASSLLPMPEVEEKKSLRLNSGKIQTREVDPSFIMGIAEVLTKSREKYDAYNWTLPTKLSTPYESAMRHLMLFQQGEDLDKDTGMSHLLHIATNIMFMHYHITNHPDECDDRFFKK